MGTESCHRSTEEKERGPGKKGNCTPVYLELKLGEGVILKEKCKICWIGGGKDRTNIVVR